MTLGDGRSTPTREMGGEPDGSYDVLVVGAGQAGLTIGYYLKQAGLRFLIVDAADSVASAWRERWDSLVLFTPHRDGSSFSRPSDFLLRKKAKQVASSPGAQVHA